MQSSDEGIEVLKRRVAEGTESLSSLREFLQSVIANSAVFIEYRQVCAAKAKLVASIAEIHRQILTLEGARSEPVQPERGRSDDIEEQLTLYQAECERRRKIAKEMIGQVSEACGVSRSELVGDLGLEMDLPRGL